jgi:sodium-dependent dicarboxylate transporter 2/3/5
VVSFVPICVLTATGILTSFDVCSLRWDVLLLIAGGLTLGIAVTDSGLANYLVESLRLSRLGELTAALLMAYVAVVLSNLMSNTAAANILVPLGLMAASGSPSIAVVPIALSASAAMALPISTPPNAVVHSTREISSRDLMEIGLIIALLAPLLTTFWCRMVL